MPWTLPRQGWAQRVLLGTLHLSPGAATAQAGLRLGLSRVFRSPCTGDGVHALTVIEGEELLAPSRRDAPQPGGVGRGVPALASSPPAFIAHQSHDKHRLVSGLIIPAVYKAAKGWGHVSDYTANKPRQIASRSKVLPISCGNSRGRAPRITAPPHFGVLHSGAEQ